MRRLALFGFILLTFDLISKWAVQAYLPLMSESSPFYPYGGIGVFQGPIEFSITHLTNTGIIWGAFQSYRVPLLVVRLALIASLLLYVARKKPRFSVSIPLMLIIAGAIGNVLDGVFYGHVIDLFFFRFWGWSYPVFNLADAYIFCGVTWLLGGSFFKKKAHA